MPISGLSVNEGTQTALAVDSVGTLEYGVVKLDIGAAGTSNLFTGTIPAISSLLGGSVVVTAGTVTTTLGDLTGGTIDLLTRTGNIGTLESGTLAVVSNLTNGSVRMTVGTITVLPNIPGGSIVVTAGTVVGAAADGAAASGNPVAIAGADSGGTIQRLLTDTSGVLQINGTVSTGGAGTQAVRLIDGTLTTITTLPNIPGGTVGLVTRVGNVGTLEVGTISTLPNIPGGTLGVVTTVTNLSNGTIQNSGTTTGVGVVSLLSAGTITRLEQGSINVTAGTVRQDYRPTNAIATYGTIFGGTAAGYGTLVAAPGAATAIYLTSLKLMNNSAGTTGLDMMIGFGTALDGTTVVERGNYITGVSRSFSPAMTGNITNTALVCYIGAAGTISANVSYWIQ